MTDNETQTPLAAAKRRVDEAGRLGTEAVRRAEEAADRAEDSVTTVVRDGVYATVGVGDAAIRGVRWAGERVQSARNASRADVEQGLTTLVQSLGGEFDRYASRGRDVVVDLRHGSAARRVADAAERVSEDAGKARRAGSQAAFSARSATRTTGRATRDAAAGVGEAVREGAGELGGTANYDEMSITELRDLARSYDISGRSNMSKAQLVAALRQSHAEAEDGASIGAEGSAHTEAEEATSD